MEISSLFKLNYKMLHKTGLGMMKIGFICTSKMYSHTSWVQKLEPTKWLAANLSNTEKNLIKVPQTVHTCTPRFTPGSSGTMLLNALVWISELLFGIYWSSPGRVWLHKTVVLFPLILSLALAKWHIFESNFWNRAICIWLPPSTGSTLCVGPNFWKSGGALGLIS